MIEKNKNEKLRVEKERTWELYEECKLYLERNERCWEVRKLEREAEIKKKERLQIANAKKENIREKVRIRTLEKEIEKAKGDLPEEVRKEIEREDVRKRRLELKEMKESLWKLRHKERKYQQKSEKTKVLDEIEDLEEKSHKKIVK